MASRQAHLFQVHCNVVTVASRQAHLFQVDGNVVTVAEACDLVVLKTLEQRLVLRAAQEKDGFGEERGSSQLTEDPAGSGHAKDSGEGAEHGDGANPKVGDRLHRRAAMMKICAFMQCHAEDADMAGTLPAGSLALHCMNGDGANPKVGDRLHF